jgi:hypothetical protein
VDVFDVVRGKGTNGATVELRVSVFPENTSLGKTPVRKLWSSSLCKRSQSDDKPDRVMEEAKASTYVDPTDDELPESDRGRLCGAPV